MKVAHIETVLQVGDCVTPVWVIDEVSAGALLEFEYQTIGAAVYAYCSTCAQLWLGLYDFSQISSNATNSIARHLGTERPSRGSYRRVRKNT